MWQSSANLVTFTFRTHCFGNLFAADSVRWREDIAKLVPLFIERHCDLSDADAYTDAKVLTRVFTRFLSIHWDNRWPPYYMQPEWCFSILKGQSKIVFRLDIAIGVKLRGLQNLV